MKKISFKIQEDPVKQVVSLNCILPLDAWQQLKTFPKKLLSPGVVFLATVVVLVWLLQFPEALSILRTLIDLFALTTQ